ncbi:MAG: hypothetical protein IJ512_08500 [Ruminococcus sp.]|nr:hypothetical protein [Ruminococcus sp.]
MKKWMAILTAMTMMSASMMSVTAAEAVQGDVDQDGVLTGHDAAMVSRHLLDDSYTLTEEQLAFADINEDGTVDQTDADMLYEVQEYHLGDVVDGMNDPWRPHISDAAAILEYYAHKAIGKEYAFTELQKNLADLDLDGDADMSDAHFALMMYARIAASLGIAFADEGIYYCSSDINSPAHLM